mgnify:FL=1
MRNIFLQKKIFFLRAFVCAILVFFCIQAFPISTSAAETIGIRAGETYYLKNASNGKYMDVYNANTFNGTNVILYAFHGANNQKFTLVHKGNGVYKLRPKHATGFAMNRNGSNIQIQAESNTSYQDFTLIRNTSSQLPGTYFVKNSGMYVMSSTAGNKVVLGNTSTYDSKALWSLEKASHGDADIFSTRYTNFDTTASDSDILNCVENRMGYTGTTNINPAKSTFSLAMSTTDILVINTHGESGRIAFYNGAGQITGIFSAKNDIDTFPYNKLSSLRVFIACGCDTGKTSSAYGNLIDSAIGKGAHFAIGWTEKISTSKSTHWTKSFFDKIGDSGAIIDEAIEHANYWSYCGSYYRKGDIKQQLSHS